MSKNEMIMLPREVVELAIEAIGDAKHKIEFDAIDALIAALKQTQNHVPDAGNMVTAGWKLVPVESTRGMIEAGEDAHYEAEKRSKEPDAWKQGGFAKRAVRAEHVFQAMLDAAPQPPAVDQQQVDQEPYLYYDPENGDTWTQEAIDDGCCPPDGLIALYTK